MSIALSGTSAAQAVSPLDAGAKADTEAADFFAKGKAAFAAQRFEEAYKAFQEAWARKKTFDTAGNLAQVDLKLGKLRDAAEHLQYAVKNFPLSGDQKPKAVMQKHLEETRSKLHTLTLDIKVPGAEIYIDGVLVGTSPHDAFFLDAGTLDQPIRRTIDVKHPGYEVWRGKALSLAGSQEYHRVDLKPIAAVPAKEATAQPPIAPQQAEGLQPEQPQPLPESKVPVRKIVIGAGIGVTAALFSTGVAFTIVSNQHASDADALREKTRKAVGSEACPTPGHGSPACEELLALGKEERSSGNIAFYTFISGGLIGGGTLVYALVKPKASKVSGVQVVPVVSAGGTGVFVRGSW
jgi:hypothetical protein